MLLPYFLAAGRRWSLSHIVKEKKKERKEREGRRVIALNYAASCQVLNPTRYSSQETNFLREPSPTNVSVVAIPKVHVRV